MPSSTAFEGFESTLVQLPNKDLWRGASYIQRETAQRKDTVDSTPDPTPVGAVDGAYAACVASAAGAHEIPCLWCGQQFPYANGEALKKHIAAQHKLAVTKPTDAQVAAAFMAEQHEPER